MYIYMANVSIKLSNEAFFIEEICLNNSQLQDIDGDFQKL